MAKRSLAVPGRERLLTGWGRTSPSRAIVLRPQSREQVETVLRTRPTRGAVARGLGRSYGDPAQNAGGFVLDTTDLNRILEVDLEHGIVNVESGVSLDWLIRRLAPLGWFVPVTPGTRYVTVGGAIAADIHGKNHHRDGGFGQAVRDFDLVTPARTFEGISRENHAEAFNATLGGMGLTGVVSRATLRMIPIETAYMSVDTQRAANIDELMQLMLAGDDGYQYSVAWVDTLARGEALGRGVLYRANHAPSEALPCDGRHDALSLKLPPAPTIPVPFPMSAVSLPAVQAFNTFWFHRHPFKERGRLQTLAQYFHQLDLVQNVNYTYGPGGLIQHQCVVPDGQEDAIRQILDHLSTTHCPCFLAVLKRMGPGSGLMSFPISGWTLAVDVPAHWDSDGSFFDAIDEIVVQAGGRLYLAKDSRTRPELIPSMYLDIDSWREIAARLDPDHLLRSDQDRRLHLRGE